jgi:magnesium chelatase family protein
VEKYPSKISGPLLDRIDRHVEVPAVPFTQLAEMPPGPTSAELRAQVLGARARQSKRFGPRGTQVHGRMTPRQVRKFPFSCRAPIPDPASPHPAGPA